MKKLSLTLFTCLSLTSFAFANCENTNVQRLVRQSASNATCEDLSAAMEIAVDEESQACIDQLMGKVFDKYTSLAVGVHAKNLSYCSAVFSNYSHLIGGDLIQRISDWVKDNEDNIVNVPSTRIANTNLMQNLKVD